MPRRPRIEYEGAAYHVMNRGDQGDRVFSDDLDYRNFLALLGKCCQRTDWQVHSYVLLRNHFHLLIETPAGNLVAGMKWFLGAYTQVFNRRHGLRGHLFQGRYKAVVVQARKGEYFETVSTYIHLNPVRAGVLNPEDLDLGKYPWSSYPAYVGKAERPPWLVVRRVLGNLGLKEDGHGQRKYREYMDRRVEEWNTKAGKKEYRTLWRPIRYGWCLGEEGFEEALVEGVKKAVEGNRRESYSGEALQRHEEKEAERLIGDGLRRMRLTETDLARMPKGATEKGLLAWRIQAHTMVSQRWIAERLRMGTPTNVGAYARRASASQVPRILQFRRSMES